MVDVAPPTQAISRSAIPRRRKLGYVICAPLSTSQAWAHCEARHRDYAPLGDPQSREIELVDSILGERRDASTHGRVEKRLGPASQVLRAGDFVRASWISRSSRRSERFECDGTAIVSVIWSFSIVEGTWQDDALQSCVVYRKMVSGGETQPDAHDSSSPVDSRVDCATLVR